MINRRPVYIQQYFIQKATAVIRFNSIAPMQDNYTQKGIYYLGGKRGFFFLLQSSVEILPNVWYSDFLF